MYLEFKAIYIKNIIIMLLFGLLNFSLFSNSWNFVSKHKYINNKGKQWMGNENIKGCKRESSHNNFN